MEVGRAEAATDISNFFHQDACPVSSRGGSESRTSCAWASDRNNHDNSRDVEGAGVHLAAALFPPRGSHLGVPPEHRPSPPFPCVARPLPPPRPEAVLDAVIQREDFSRAPSRRRSRVADETGDRVRRASSPAPHPSPPLRHHRSPGFGGREANGTRGNRLLYLLVL